MWFCWQALGRNPFIVKCGSVGRHLARNPFIVKCGSVGRHLARNPFIVKCGSVGRHLARNPFICDCNLHWLAEYLHSHPIETSGARCDSPRRMRRKKIGHIRHSKFKCKGMFYRITSRIIYLISQILTDIKSVKKTIFMDVPV